LDNVIILALIFNNKIMGLIEMFSSSEKKEEGEGRRNDGFDKQAVPSDGTNITEREIKGLEEIRKEKEGLEEEITEIERDPENPKYKDLHTLRDKLRELNDRSI